MVEERVVGTLAGGGGIDCFDWFGDFNRDCYEVGAIGIWRVVRSAAAGFGVYFDCGGRAN